MFWLKKKVLLKNHKQLSNDTFKAEPNKKNSAHKKTVQLRDLRNALALYLH